MANRLLLLFILICNSGLTVFADIPGTNCISCHSNFKVAGSVYSDLNGKNTLSGISFTFIKPDGNQIVLSQSISKGSFSSTIITDGEYLVKSGNIQSKTWHKLPEQASCNTCHFAGGNGNPVRTKTMSYYHTSIPAGNDCRNCHFYPATMNLSDLKTNSVLNTQTTIAPIPKSQVQIGSNTYTFNPAFFSIKTVRPDIFAEGYYSMFDVILAVAAANNILIEYHWDESCMTHWITKINNVSANYWYHFSYDAGSGNNAELNYKRANRWDEALWRPGVWIKIVNNENVAEIRNEYTEEINREKKSGKIIPSVKFTINPSNYKGNPTGSGRVSVSREFKDVLITAHNLRSTGFKSPYSKPFKPGVVTSMDIPLSLMDSGNLTAFTNVFYNYFGGKYIDSYYIVELGFPGIGNVHSSGRQGIVYVTENGTFQRLPNDADIKMHMTSDIHVIHSPDFSYWRWIELGNPYYEGNLTSAELLNQSITEDYEAISRGFNLHNPYPNPVKGKLNFSFNIFDPGMIEIAIYDLNGKKVNTILSKLIPDIGIQKHEYDTSLLPNGMYLLIMKHGNNIQEKKIVLLN